MAWHGFRPVDVPEHSHPAVRRLFEEMNAQKVNTYSLEAISGICASAIKQWRYRRVPRIDNIEACLNALGLELVVQHKEPKK